MSQHHIESELVSRNVPAIIRSEATARGLSPNGRCAQAGSVLYWVMTNGHALGYDFKDRRYRYRSVAGYHLPLRTFVPEAPAPVRPYGRTQPRPAANGLPA